MKHVFGKKKSENSILFTVKDTVLIYLKFEFV